MLLRRLATYKEPRAISNIGSLLIFHNGERRARGENQSSFGQLPVCTRECLMPGAVLSPARSALPTLDWRPKLCVHFSAFSTPLPAIPRGLLDRSQAERFRSLKISVGIGVSQVIRGESRSDLKVHRPENRRIDEATWPCSH